MRANLRYWFLQAASAASFLGDGIRFTALPLLAAAIGAGPFAVSAMFIAGTLPWLLVSPYAGTVVDRVNRVQLLAITDTARAVLAVAILLTVLMSTSTPIAALIAASFLFGVLEVFYDIAGAATIPGLVEDDRLGAAFGLFSAAQTVGRELGGPLAGALLFTVTQGTPFATCATLYVIAAVLLHAIGQRRRIAAAADLTADDHQQTACSTTHNTTQGADSAITAPETDGAAGGSWVTSAAAAVRFLIRSRALLTISLVSASVNIAVLASQATNVLFVTRTLHGSDFAYAAIVACPAAAAALTAASAGPLLKTVRTRTTLIGALALATAAFTWVAVAHTVWWAAIGFFALGISFALWNVAVVTYRQRLVSDELRGRVEGVYRFISWGAMPIGALAGGLLARLSLRAPLVLAAALSAAALLLLLLRRASIGDPESRPARGQ